MRPRVRGVLLAAPCIVLLALAWSVTPNPSGHGTARDFGLPECSFLVNTGWFCPSCGMTTSMAAAVRGQIGQALRAQPFGVVLALAAVVLGATGLGQAITGRYLMRVFRPGWWWLAAGLGGMLAGWGIRTVLGMADGTFPMR